MSAEKERLEELAVLMNERGEENFMAILEEVRNFLDFMAYDLPHHIRGEDPPDHQNPFP